MKIHSPIAITVTRVAMVFFWLAVIVGFLFSPRLFFWWRQPKSINVYTFPQLLDVPYLQKFEQQTGIKVYVNYYESNDELLVKMRQTKGRGYDIIIPSDYAVAELINYDLVQPLDKAQLPFWSSINTRLMGHYYDPSNTYAIPYFWGLFGIGINKNFFGGNVPHASWKLIFDQQTASDYMIGMINNPREAISLAALYLFGSLDNMPHDAAQQVQKLLLKQKQWVHAYTDVGPDYILLSESAPVVASLSGEVWQAKRFNDAIEFIIPQEGTFMVIDNLVISKQSTKLDEVYQFINFLYQPSTIKRHIEHYSYFPPLVQDEVASTKEAGAFAMLEQVKAVYFFKNIFPQKLLSDIWLAVKAR